MKQLTRQEKAAAKLRWETQAAIIKRAKLELDAPIDAQSLSMDLESVPELDLPKLLNAPRFDFIHDICGIVRNMDRSNYPGKLMNCFWPRCAKQS